MRFLSVRRWWVLLPLTLIVIGRWTATRAQEDKRLASNLLVNIEGVHTLAELSAMAKQKGLSVSCDPRVEPYRVVFAGFRQKVPLLTVLQLAAKGIGGIELRRVGDIYHFGISESEMRGRIDSKYRSQLVDTFPHLPNALLKGAEKLGPFSIEWFTSGKEVLGRDLTEEQQWVIKGLLIERKSLKKFTPQSIVRFVPAYVVSVDSGKPCCEKIKDAQGREVTIPSVIGYYMW